MGAQTCGELEIAANEAHCLEDGTRILRLFHRFGCVGYTVLAILVSIPLLPLAYLILKTGDERTIAILSTALVVVAAVVAATVVLLRRTELLMACAVWVPIYFVSYLSLLLSLNTVGNGYRLTENPAFSEWNTFFLSLAAYQVPVLVVHAVSNWRAGTGWFKPNVARAKARKNVRGLIRALGSRNSAIRAEAASALSEVGDERAVEPLIAALKDTHPAVRGRAADALAQTGDRRAIGPLLALLRDTDGLVSSSAARALGTLGSPRAVEPLIACLESRDLFLRSAAIASLAELKDARAIEPLAVVMIGGSEADRDEAIRALAKIGQPRALDAIRDFLCQHPSQRQATGRSLAASTWSGAHLGPELMAWVATVNSNWELAVSQGQAAVEPLSTRLWDEDREAALAAIEALARLGGAEAARHLASRMNSGDDIAVRESAARALGRIGAGQAFEPLLQALEKAYEGGGTSKLSLMRVRCAAAEVLGQLGDRRAVPALIATLQRQKDELRQAAALALGRITGQELGDEADAWQTWLEQQR